MNEAVRLYRRYLAIGEKLRGEMAGRFPEPRSAEQTQEAIGWLRTRRAELMREEGFRPWSDKETDKI